MPVLFSNNASATLASSITSTATVITVSTGLGALFPALPSGSYCYGTLTDSSNNLEIVKVTARAADNLTVVRGQEGTTPRSYAAGDLLELRVTAAGLSNNVQLDGAQTITGVKTFSSGIISAVTGNVTGNLTGNVTGNLTGNVTGNLTGAVTGNATTATSSTQITNSGGWSVTPSGGALYFNYNGTNVASLNYVGDLTVLGNVTAYGTP
jgi:hypothetical protein